MVLEHSTTLLAMEDDDQRKSIVQQIVQKSTEFLKRIIVLVGRTVRGNIVVRVSSRPLIPTRIWFTFSGSPLGTVTARARRSSVKGKKQCGGLWRPAHLEGLEQSLGSTGQCGVRARISRVLSSCWRISRRAGVGGHDLRRFVEAEQVETHESTEEVSSQWTAREAVKIGGLEKKSEAVKVVRPKDKKRDFSECGHPRRGGRTDAFTVDGPRLVWTKIGTAIYQAIWSGVEGAQ